MNSVNNHINTLKKQQLAVSKKDKKQLEKEFKDEFLVLIGIFTSLSNRYNNSTKYMQLRIIQTIKRELVKYGEYFIDYQKDFIHETLKNTFDNNYNELYKIFSKHYDNSIEKSLITESDINKIIDSKFFNKTLNKRIAYNTTLIFNKLDRDIKNEITKNNDIANIIKVLNDNAESLINIQNRLLDTEEARMFNEVQKKIFSDFSIEHLIWRSVLEKNTCSTCASREGQPFSIKDIDMIPVHSWCNCYWEIVENNGKSDIIEENKELNKEVDYDSSFNGKYEDKEVREWYVNHDKNIINIIDTTKTIKEQAIEAHSLRNKYRTEARLMMKDRDKAEELNKTRANIEFEDLVKSKMQRKNLTEEEAYLDIINTAGKTNKEVNKKFNLE